MKMTLTFVCTMSAIFAIGAAQKPSAKKTSFSESELRTLAQAVPDVKTAGQLFTVAMAASNNVEQQQAYLKVAAACLVACDRTDIYRKYVKGKLQNVEEIEDELEDECTQCSGSGTRKHRCSICRGNGQCPTCKGTGQIKTTATASFSFNKLIKPCSKCNESGQCPKCDGEGSTEGKCLACAGTGKAFSKTAATRIFHDSCSAIADSMKTAIVTTNRSDRDTKQKDVYKEATIAEIIKMAQDGDVEAQFKLAECYHDGVGVEKDLKEAVKWCRKAAEQGKAKAQIMLSVSYYYGNGVSQDKIEALKWCRKAAEQGDAEAQYNLGQCYYKGDGVLQSKTEAAKWYRKAAEQGDAKAQYNLGVCYDVGVGVPQDKTEAVKWFRKAAVQGDALAQYNLGLCYGKGEGVSQDRIEAMKWARKAAEQGDAQGQCLLGTLYLLEGMTQNKVEGVKWLRKAASQGDEIAVECLRRLGVGF